MAFYMAFNGEPKTIPQRNYMFNYMAIICFLTNMAFNGESMGR